VAVNPNAGFPAALPWGQMAAHSETESPKVTLTAPPRATDTGLYNSRLIGLAMLIGALAAAVVSLQSGLTATRAFFDGAGYGFANIISLIVTANCFAVGVREIGLAAGIGHLIELLPVLLMPLAGILPLGFALLCGSGMASTAGLFGFFAGPAVAQDVDPALVGAVVALASAAGRTMSPVAAVMLMCATLTNTSPFDLFRRVALPLVFGVVLVVIAAMVMTVVN
jgi:DcuC family C4-dicarboxylate transporter